jgi:glycosyltransferase involved in cell wall biosynthesis
MVSIIVPAHNEERVIDACAASLRAQRHPALEIIFVLDRCTDRTREILLAHAHADARIKIVENDACPEDWAGKCNAARLGAERATGAYLLFTDADTWFDPDLVSASLALARDRGLGLLSLLSTLTCTHAWERIAQPVASMNLVRMYPISRVNREENARPFANGQFMLFDRECYERIGGHRAVKDDLLEDIAFARKVYASGSRCGIYIADDMLRCSMYDSLGAFVLGWKRIFIEACKRKPTRLRRNAWSILSTGVGLPALQVVAFTLGILLLHGGHPVPGAALVAVVTAGVTVQIVTLMWVYALCGTPRLPALLYPVGCWIVGRIMLDGARDLAQRRPVTWAGRTYVLEPRE